jgi:pre-mRNA-processing factor 6
MLAAQKEEDPKIKSKIYRRSLEHLPTEVDLWKMLVELEEPEEAKILLTKAVVCVPKAVNLWLALAKLE